MKTKKVLWVWLLRRVKFIKLKRRNKKQIVMEKTFKEIQKELSNKILTEIDYTDKSINVDGIINSEK